jgi:DNA-binding XRE family transcriptional regulator
VDGIASPLGCRHHPDAMDDVNDVARVVVADEGGAMLDATSFLRALGAALRERREELHLTQEALSLRTGVPQRRIWELEAGAGNPTTRTLLRLVSGLDSPCSQLVARAEQLVAADLTAERSAWVRQTPHVAAYDVCVVVGSLQG